MCSNLRNLPWFCPQSADEFFPRCYKFSQEDDKIGFIDDYRITCCIGLLKYVLIKHRGEPDDDDLDVHITSAEELKKMKLAQGEAEPSQGPQTPTNSSDKENQQNGEDVSPRIIEPLKSVSGPTRKLHFNKNISFLPVLLEKKEYLNKTVFHLIT